MEVIMLARMHSPMGYMDFSSLAGMQGEGGQPMPPCLHWHRH